MINKNHHAYKTISEVAELLNLVNSKTGKISTHTLRFWEKEFKQIKPKVFAGKRRYYDQETIEILKNIKFLLKDKGMTIKGVKKYLLNDKSKLDETNNTTINTKNILKSKLNKISKIIKELKK
jgi:DNA-binding transcriptional MerR regulator